MKLCFMVASRLLSSRSLFFPTSLTAHPALTLTCLHPFVFCCTSRTNKVERPQRVCHNWSTDVNGTISWRSCPRWEKASTSLLAKNRKQDLGGWKGMGQWASNDSGTVLSSISSTSCSLYPSAGHKANSCKQRPRAKLAMRHEWIVLTEQAMPAMLFEVQAHPGCLLVFQHNGEGCFTILSWSQLDFITASRNQPSPTTVECQKVWLCAHGSKSDHLVSKSTVSRGFYCQSLRIPLDASWGDVLETWSCRSYTANQKGNLQRCLKVIKQVTKPHKASPSRKDRKVSSLLNNFDGFPTSWNIDSTWMLNLAFSKRREICRATTYWLNDKATVRHCWHLLTFRGHFLGGQVQVPQGP